jgi:UDP-N-acetylglucosamine transferase subunit ALG13
MIFVTVGTTHFQFDRLIVGVASLETDEEFVVQRGPSLASAGNARVVDFLSFGELADYIRRSRVVVSHAGVGSIMVALSEGRRPIVVPRLARFGEAVDDHQVQVAEMLAERDRVRLVMEPESLGDAVTRGVDADSTAPLGFGPLVDVVAGEVERAVRLQRTT